MGKELFHPYTNNEGKEINGAAAFNHYVYTEMGGIQQYNDAIGKEYISAFVDAHSDEINANIIANSKRKRFKII